MLGVVDVIVHQLLQRDEATQHSGVGLANALNAEGLALLVCKDRSGQVSLVSKAIDRKGMANQRQVRKLA